MIATGSPVVDNFATRTFGGHASYFKPLGTISDSDLKTAMSVLALFGTYARESLVHVSSLPLRPPPSLASLSGSSTPPTLQK